MKNVILKTKKLEQIIYNQGYICINSHYLIKADLIQLDDTLLQDKINKNEPFYFNKFNNNFGTPPDVLAIIPKDFSEFIELENTGLKTDIHKTTADVFYNPETKLFVYFNSEYLKLFTDTGATLKLIQSKNRYNPAIVLDDNYECKFFIMSMANKNAYLEKFENVL